MSEVDGLKRLDKALAALQRIPDDLRRLDAVRRARESLEELEAQTVAQARASGATWRDIGRLYGMSKQGAQQRFFSGRVSQRGDTSGAKSGAVGRAVSSGQSFSTRQTESGDE